MPMMVLLVAITLGRTAEGGTPPGPGADAATAAAILDDARGNIDRVASLKYRFTSVSERKAVTYRYRCELILQGSKFHNSFEIENSKSATPMKQTYAFDGSTYQSLNADKAFLGTDSKIATDRPYFLPQPINTMFEFAYGPKEPRTLETLRQARRWADLAARARVLPGRRVGEYDCEVLEIAPEAGGDGPTTVAFAKALHHYPVEVQRADDKTSTRSLVLGAESVETTAGPVAVPTKLRELITPKGSKLEVAFETTVDPGSLAINQDIPAATFSIPRSQAKVVFDVAKRQVVSQGRPVPSKPRLLDVTPWYSRTKDWLLLGSGSALVAAVAIVAIRRRRRA